MLFLWQGQKDLVSPAGSVGASASQRSPPETRAPRHAPRASASSRLYSTKNKNGYHSVTVLFLAGAEGHARFTGCILVGRCFATAPDSDFGAKNSSLNCFLHAPHPLGVQALLYYTLFHKQKNHPIGWFLVFGRGRRT